ncbi:unnamed protein product [Durusdinium trenchii]|uniref:Band 7 domain-containing protein n=1 Tax=Durusdinium trenchii TaxID=1381693 RepID=A0ABP0SH61_9DINO
MACAAVGQRSVHFLGQDEQLLVEGFTGMDVHNGPGTFFLNPFTHRSATIRKAETLGTMDYVKVRHVVEGKERIEKGPQLLFLAPYEQIVERSQGLSAEILRVPKTHEQSHRKGTNVVLELSGPDDELLDGQVMQLIDLKVHEYVKILDQSTGTIRVESGSNGTSKQVFLGPHDKVLDNGKKKAVEVDGEHAVLVRDKSSGQVRLVTEKQLFIPGPNESIEKVQELIKLADHEALIVKNKQGEFQYFYGSDEKRPAGQPRAFFLEPYAEIVKLCWSKGRRRETRNLFIERFDCRAQFMSFEFNCRTSDNVELILEGTFFWEVVDLPAMVKSTGDTSGDLCNHARSQFIRHVARVTLKEFMDSSHSIAKKVWEEDTGFYASRGVKIHSLEVTRYQCADSRTSEILEQIIQETTNRMNRLSQAESENEVSLFRTQGQIEQERLNGDLLAIKHQHSEAEAEVVGRAEANKVAAFIAGLEAKVPKLEDRMALWQVLRKNEALSAISEGNASLYYTPSDVDLSIEAKR